MLQTVIRPSIDKIADRLAAILDHIAGAAGRAGRADHRKRDVLGGHAGLELAGDLDLHVLRFLLDQRLGREHMLDLGRADPVRQRAEGAMRRGVAVAADHGHAGQGPALFRPDDMDDALADVVHRVVMDTEILGVPCRAPRPASGCPRSSARGSSRPAVVGTLWSGTAMVLSGACTLRPAMRRPFESLRAGHLVHEVAIDVEQTGAVLGRMGQMGIPDLVVKRLPGHAGSPCWVRLKRSYGPGRRQSRASTVIVAP